MRTIRLQIAATETSCQSKELHCSHIKGAYCAVFRALVWDVLSEQYKRLPECIAAEKEARK